MCRPLQILSPYSKSVTHSQQGGFIHRSLEKKKNVWKIDTEQGLVGEQGPSVPWIFIKTCSKQPTNALKLEAENLSWKNLSIVLNFYSVITLLWLIIMLQCLKFFFNDGHTCGETAQQCFSHSFFLPGSNPDILSTFFSCTII